MNRVVPSPRLIARAASFALLLTALAGPARAISTRTTIGPTGLAAGDNFGKAIAHGDFNGDGYPDLIVGSPGSDNAGTNAGRVYVYFGGPNADATADRILSGQAANENFGSSVCSGDFNGDGVDDILVGAPNNAAAGAGAGRAYVFYGGPNPDVTVDITFNAAAAGDQFGTSVAALDMNGDGFDDAVVGAPNNDAGGADAGRAYVFLGTSGPDNIVDLTLTGAAAGDWFGFSVANAHDLNGDGDDDLIVGAPLNDAIGADGGRAYVYFGGAILNNNADLTLTGIAGGDQFGASVAGVGDENGDGFPDLFVGAPLNDTAFSNAGAAYVFYGGGVMDATADLTVFGSAVNEQLGLGVGAAGDVNGDGFADLIAGAQLDQTGGAGAGAAQIYFGGASPNSVADAYVLGAPLDGLGGAVAGIGDFDGDGFDDIAVGVQLASPGGLANAGRAQVVLLYPYQVVSPNGGEQWVAGRPATVHWRGHDAADIAVSLDGGATFSTLVSGVGGAEDNTITVTAPGTASSSALLRVSQTGLTVRHSVSDVSDASFKIALPATPPAAAWRTSLTLPGAAAQDQFGSAVASAGDVNGDGYADVIVGAPSNDAAGANAGRAYVYFGGPNADNVPDWILTGAAAGDQFGWSVAGAGDVNHDGYDDVIVGAPFNDTGGTDAGRVYVFFGGPAPDAVADLSPFTSIPGEEFGWSVSGAGDVNGDGFADVIVGAPSDDVAATNAGRAYVFFGGIAPDNIADMVIAGAAVNGQLGTSVAGAGDVNGDGFDDVIVGTPGALGGGAVAGSALLYFGGEFPNTTPDITLNGEAAGDLFGYWVAGAGDVNGDGYSDVIVGAPLNDAGGASAGRAYVYLGGPNMDAAADQTFTGSTAGEDFGISVAGAGDVNGDGFADVVVGADLDPAGGNGSGRASVYFGGPGADAFADALVPGTAVGDELGYAVASAGDVNGDGFADLIIGVPLNDAVGTNAGRAVVVDFNRYFVQSPNGGETLNVGATSNFSWLGAEPADLWLSADGGASYQLLDSHVGGASLNSIPVRVPHTPSRFARIRVTPSDLSVKGSDRSDSLFTIQTSVSLLNMVAELDPNGGAALTWSSDPAVGPGGLAGYRLYRVTGGATGNGARIGPDLIAETHYTDPAGAAGTGYRLTSVNGLGEELELGRVELRPAASLAAWPMPYRGGAMTVSFATAGGLGGGRGAASVELFDLSGRHVRTLARGAFTAGQQMATWDGRDEQGTVVRNGVYFLRAETNGFEHHMKLVVAR